MGCGLGKCVGEDIPREEPSLYGVWFGGYFTTLMKKALSDLNQGRYVGCGLDPL